MATKSVFICSNCGNQSSRWQGKCANCGAWNSYQEQTVSVSNKSKTVGVPSGTKPISLSEVKSDNYLRVQSGIAELDTVLGGGLVPGAVILLGGDPGIGKSTLALQLANLLAKQNHDVLYVTGEESAQQIKMRNDRLPIKQDISVLADTDYDNVVAVLSTQKPEIVIIDSIQTLNSAEVNGVQGGVAQLSYVTNGLVRLAKQHHITTIVIGHVTKEGMLAGPKTIEHMVDVVLYLEGDRLSSLRLLRSSKNRFGSIGEVGVFQMVESGLEEVANPAAMFLEHKDKTMPGSCVAVVAEGNKILLVEVQALTNTTTATYPKRVASGFDINRLQLLSAILQKSLGVNLSNQDIYINIAGGFKVTERAADLPVVLAILSSYYGKDLGLGTAAYGEVGLLGEVRAVPQVDKRSKEAKKLGYSNLFNNKTLKSINDIKLFSKK